MPEEEFIPGGARLEYIGNRTEFYGQTGVYLYKNQCNCAHQTYVIQLDNGKRLEKVLRESFRLL